jgi:hypothetical protein
LPDDRRPVWPNADDEQQTMMHLDIAVEDVDAAAAGPSTSARRLPIISLGPATR